MTQTTRPIDPGTGLSAPSGLDRYFRLSERGTSTRTEVLAGFTTFLTMAYIVLVNPAVLGQAGMPVAAVAAAGVLFIYQQKLIANREREACFKAFLNNNYVGLVLFVGLAISYWA